MLGVPPVFVRGGSMTRRDLVLRLLRECEIVTTADFLKAGCGNRFSARIKELRDEGFEVKAERIRDGSWAYWLTHDAERSTFLSGAALDAERPLRRPGAGQTQDADASPPPLFEMKPRHGDYKDAA